RSEWSEYSGILRRRLELDVDEAVLVDLKYRLGETLGKHLDDEPSALECYREVLLIDPDEARSRAALEGMIDHERLGTEVARTLADVYEARQDWGALAGVLERLIDAEPDSEVRVRLLRRVSVVASQHLGDVPRAFSAASRALLETPENEELHAEFRRLGTQGENWSGLAKVYAEIAGAVTDGGVARTYWLRLAAIQEQTGQIDAAAASYTKILEGDPADAEALDALELVYENHARYEDVVTVVRRRLELAVQNGEREALLAQVATIFDEKLQQPEQAVSAYVEILGFDDRSRVALRALESLYGRQELHEQLAGNLEQQIRAASDEDEETALMLRLAKLQESKLGLAPAAIETYRLVLERRPNQEEALEALEAIGARPEFEIEIAETLGPLYRAAGNYAKLVAVYEVQVRRAEDPARTVELLHEIAQLLEDAASDPAAAFDVLVRAFAVEPSSSLTQDGLQRLAGATRRYADLARVYEEQASQQSDADLAIALYAMAASLQQNQLGAVESAISLYRRMLDLDPTHLAALDALEVLFQQNDRSEELSATLQQRALLLTDLELQKAALFDAALIEESVLGRTEHAIAVFRKVLELDGEDLRALDSLIRIMLGLQRWTELLAVYARKVELVYDPDERKRIYYQAGAVYERELSDELHAIDTYQRILEIDPDDLEALGRLDALYQATQNWVELLNVLQRQSELSADPREAVSFQFRIAELYDRRLEDIARAIELYRELLAGQPDHRPTLDALEALTRGEREPVAAAQVLEPVYQAMGDSGRLIGVLEVQIARSQDSFSQIEMLTRIATIYEDALSDPARAFETYARAVAIDSRNEDLLAQYERLAAQAGRWVELATLYDGQLVTVPADEPERFVELALRLARIFEEQLENWDAAIARYAAVLNHDTENLIALASLDRLYEHTERWTELVGILEREAGTGTNDPTVYRFRLAQVHQYRLGDLASAIAAYGEVLQLDPSNDGALTALEQLFNAGQEQPRIAAILEPFYETVGQFDYLAGVYEAVLAHTVDPEDRLGQLHRLAEVNEQRLGVPGAALAVYLRALAEFVTDERVLAELERLAGMVEDGWAHLANAYADVLSHQTDSENQRMLGKRLARVYEEELRDVQRAEESFAYVLTVAPQDEEVLENLDRIYTATGNAGPLAGVLEQRALLTEDGFAKIEFYLRLGELYELHLGPQDPRFYEEAIRVYRTVLDGLDPSNETAQTVLERIYGQAQRWPELYSVYERQLASAGGDFEKGEITSKMARIAMIGLGDARRSIELWRRVLDLKGEDGEALGSLGELYEQTEQWAELTEVLERHLATVTDEREHVAVLLRRARLHSQQLQRDDLALDDYARALEIDFANLDALYAVADIARRRFTGELPHESRGNPRDLLLALHQIAERAAQLLPAEHLVVLYRELATLHQLDPAQRREAIEALRRLIEINPRDFDSMAQLESLLRLEQAWQDVAELKLLRARAHASPTEQLREYLEVASVWSDKVGDPDGATRAYEAVLQLDPAHDEAFGQLERLHRAAERWEALVELLVARVETRDDVHEQTALLRKVAKIFQEQIGDPAQAYDSLETAFALDVTDDETVAQLEKVTAATKHWNALIQSANGLLEEASDPRVQVVLCLRLDLDRQDFAQPYYARVQQLEPNNVQVRRQAATYLRKQGDWRSAGQRLEEALAYATRDSDRAAILTDVGELLERYAGEPEQGLARYRRAVEVDPGHLPALEALERIYESRNSTQDLVQILELKLKALKDPERVSDVRMRIGAMYEGILASPEKAIALYRGVLEHDAANLPAIRGLERVYTTTQRWQEMLEVLDMHLDVAVSERERADVLLRIANLQEEEFRKPDLASIRLEQVVEIDPANLTAFEALARCYQKQQQWHGLSACLDRFVQMVDDRQRKMQLLMWQGQVHSDQLQDLGRALDAYIAIIELDPNHIPALEALAKLYERMEDPANAIEFTNRVAELTSDGGQRVESFYRLGKQLEEKLGDRGQARAKFEQALDLNPYHLPTLAAMRAIAVDESDWYHATKYLETEQQYTESPRLRAKLLVELGRLRTEVLEQPDAGLQAYSLANQADPDNEDAALPLARACVARGAYVEAEPLTDLLEKKAPSKDRDVQLEFYLLHGKVELELKKGPEALRAFTAAHRIDLTNRDAIRGLGDAYFVLADWPGALTNYQKVLTALSDDEGAIRAEVLYRLGSVKREQGQAKQAINNFEKALELEPTHRPTLEALSAMYVAQGDWAQACAYRQLILDTILDGEERFAFLLDLSEQWENKVGDAVQALAAMEQAVALKPEDHLLQHRLLALFQKTARWHDVVWTLRRIADGDPNPQRRARYMFTMGQVHRDKLEEPYQAIELFEQALDLHPEFVDAFARIDKILSSLGDWPKLERSYRKMIHRVAGKGNADLEYQLFHSLGLIYRDRLQDFAKATEAFRGAVAIKPDAVEERVILAELAVHTGDASRALEQFRTLLEKDALNVDAYRSIYTIHLQQQQYDDAWCIAGILAFIGRANEEELRFYDDWKPQDVAQLTGALDGSLWVQHVFHPDEDLHIGKIFEAIAPAALKAKIADLTAKNQRPVLQDNQRQDPATSGQPLARTFWWAAKGLGLQAPQLYARPDQAGLLLAVPNIPLTSVAGQTALQGLTPIERAFVCGKHLAMYRGEHLIKTLFPTVTELTVLLFGAVRLVAQMNAPPEYANQVQATSHALSQFIEPIQREALKVAVNEFMKAGARANIKRWAQAVETTAARAGLLLAGDLAVAKKVIVSEPQLPGDISPQERMKDLMLYVASADYGRLRKLLGLSIRTE
ncbi:MAG: tetratricopeptide repeat protein, partial [Deltaproteobacteria bacterium]|nr:tetratricopeptide repeat protein [Deltaproteobacteria bacterium]